MKKLLILFFMILLPLTVIAFGTGTTKQIDQIDNNTGTNIILNPVSAVQINSMSGNKALQTNASKELEESTTTDTELGYLSGVTSSIQTQINSKVNNTRLITTTAPMLIDAGASADLSADRTLSMTQATSVIDGWLSSTDWNTFNNKSDYVTPLTTNGDLIYYNSSEQRLPIGTNGQLLTVSSGLPSWQDAPTSVSVTTKGDLQTFSTVPDRLPVGVDGKILSANSAESTGLEWIDAPAGYISPTTTQGDLILRGVSFDERLAIGTPNQLLTSNGTTASWQDAPVSTTLTTKGDIQTFSTVNAALPVGNDGEFLVADSNEVTGLKYTNTLTGTLNPVTDWVGYTPTFTGIGTPTGVDFRWMRIGDSILIRGYGVAGTVAASVFSMSIPSGLTINTSKVSSTANTQKVGSYQRFNNGSNSYTMNFSAFVDPATNGTLIYVSNVLPNDANFNKDNGSTITETGDAFFIDAIIPIDGWSSGLNAIVENKILTPLTSNTISVNIETLSSGNQCNITSSQFDLSGFISCSRTGVGLFTLDYSGLSLTEKAGLTFGCEKNDCEFSDGSFPSTTSTGFVMSQGGVATDGEISITLSKHGADMNKNVINAAIVNPTVCTKKRLNSNVTVTGVISDLTFTGIESGANYQIRGRIKCYESADTASKRCRVKAFQNALVVSHVEVFETLSTGTFTDYSKPLVFNDNFTATSSGDLTFNATDLVGTILDGATEHPSEYIELCKLPSSYTIDNF